MCAFLPWDPPSRKDNEVVMDVWQVDAEMVDGFHYKLYSTKKDAAQE